jgi:hypothetical protein
VTGEVAQDETAKLVLVSEDKIKILNTWANGRDHQAQGSDIVINAVMVALDSDSGHFTFDEQNDNWESYLGPTPDERGRIHLTGSVFQKFKGYVHRSNNSGTGYLKDYKHDQRLNYWSLPIFENPDFELEPQVLEFDSVEMGDIITDSIRIVLVDRALIDIPQITEGEFTTSQRLYVFDSTLYVPVTFSPPELGDFAAEIPAYIEGNYYTIPVTGVGVEIEAADPNPEIISSFSFSAYPNPFNPTTTIQFSLTKNEKVTLALYNTSGQLVQTLVDEVRSAGEHRVQLSGTALPSGVYFARLQSAAHIATHKLLLLK